MGFGNINKQTTGGGSGGGIPAWDNTKTYAVNDIVAYNGLLYRAIVASINSKPTTALNAWEHLGAPTSWSPTATYHVNSIVGYGNKVFICLVKNRNNNPLDVAASWKELAIGAQPGVRVWDSSTTYSVGDFITYGGKMYKVTTGNVNSRPDSNPTYYTEFGAGGGAS